MKFFEKKLTISDLRDGAKRGRVESPQIFSFAYLYYFTKALFLDSAFLYFKNPCHLKKFL